MAPAPRALSLAEAHIGAAATKARLLARAADVEIIHLAAHADVDEIDPLYSTIHLARSERAPGDSRRTRCTAWRCRGRGW